MTEPTIPSQPSPASLVIHRLALSPVLTVCLIFGGLSLPQEVAAGTESFRRSCTNIRVSQINGSTLIRANCDDGRSRESTWNRWGVRRFSKQPYPACHTTQRLCRCLQPAWGAALHRGGASWWKLVEKLRRRSLY